MRTWIKHWLHRWTSPELTLIRRTPQGDGSLVTWVDLLTLAAADHCDGELWVAPGVPHTTETLAAVLHRDVIWLQAAIDPLMRCGLLHWAGSHPPVLVITHWNAEQEPLQAVDRRRALAAERNRRYRRRQALQLSQQPAESESQTGEGLRLLREFRQRHT